MGCAPEISEKEEPSAVSSNARADIAERAGDAEAENEDTNCLRTCSTDARSGAYADCLAAGEAQSDCAGAARLWYVDCIEATCSDVALQIDACRTDCRLQSAREREACQPKGAAKEDCMHQATTTVRTCVAACGSPAASDLGTPAVPPH